MRPSYSTITPSVVHHFARSVLERTLGFQPSKPSVSLHQLLDLLLVIAATTRTLFAVVGRYFDFSHETSRHSMFSLNASSMPCTLSPPSPDGIDDDFGHSPSTSITSLITVPRRRPESSAGQRNKALSSSTVTPRPC